MTTRKEKRETGVGLTRHFLFYDIQYSRDMLFLVKSERYVIIIQITTDAYLMMSHATRGPDGSEQYTKDQIVFTLIIHQAKGNGGRKKKAFLNPFVSLIMSINLPDICLFVPFFFPFTPPSCISLIAMANGSYGSQNGWINHCRLMGLYVDMQSRVTRSFAREKQKNGRTAWRFTSLVNLDEKAAWADIPLINQISNISISHFPLAFGLYVGEKKKWQDESESES